MASKQSLFRLVEQLGCEIDFEPDYIGVKAPRGKVFGDYMHYSGYGVGSYGDYKKSEVYQSLTDELSSMRDCEDVECNDGCVEFNQQRKEM